MNRKIVMAFAALLCAVPAQASSNIESAGTYVAIALPVAAGSITVWKDDWRGTEQLFFDTGLTVGTALLLKQVVREQRPDHSDFKSFPSDTSALAFAPAQFLWDRYGWEYGVPAYAAAAFVGYSRVDAKRHHWWDVAASAAISFGYSKLITTEFRPTKSLYTDLEASPGGIYASVHYTW
jgi:membrane-associated phospholipid phosphatase